MEFDYDLFLAIEDAHSLMLRHQNHEGAAHCECRLAKWLREFSERYHDSLRREAKRRKCAATRERNRKREEYVAKHSPEKERG